jgi:mono/diheme cytochrome c family protein
MNALRFSTTFLLAAAILLALPGCRRDMYEQPKFLPDQQNYFFPGEQVDRPPVAHTVPRGPVEDNSVFYTGETGNALATTFPVPVTPELVAHGQEAFDINCSACHGRDGYGLGMVVQRGFPQPPSFHSDRLRNAPVGHFFAVITEGYGAMYPFGSRIDPADRWAIISYIRALQFSQHAPLSQLSPSDQGQLEQVK